MLELVPTQGAPAHLTRAYDRHPATAKINLRSH